MTNYIPIFVMLLVVLLMIRNQKQMMIKQLIKNKNSKEKLEMTELARRFIGKECIVYTFNGSNIDCTVKEVTDGAILVEKKGIVEAINIDFIMRIREYPKNKNGKKKSIIVD